MKILNFKTAFLFIIELSYCLPVFVFADCKQSFRRTYINSFRKPYVTAEQLPPVEEFRRVVIENKDIKTQYEYELLRKEDRELLRFPFFPKKRYSGFQWPGRGNRSTDYITAKKLPSEAEFRRVVILEKNIKTQYEYVNRRKTDEELLLFPSDPRKRYSGFRWPGNVNRYITKDKLPSETEFWRVVINEKGIRTRLEYEQRRQTDEELLRFPSKPQYRYEGFRWPGMRAYVTAEQLPSEAEFRRVVIREKGVKNQFEYENRRKTDEELLRFPRYPKDRYKDFTWPFSFNPHFPQ